MNKDNAIFIMGMFIGFVIVIASGWLILQNLKLSNINTENVVNEKTPTPLPTAIPYDYKNTKIQVLNASGKAGVAKKYADKLKELGYTKVEIGNYSEKTSSNILFAPTNLKEQLEKIGFFDYEYKVSETIKVVVLIP